MNDVSLIVTSIFGGCLMGLFMVGFFSTRVDGVAATIAMIIAILFNVYLGMGLLGWLPTDLIWELHSYWVGAMVNLIFVCCAFLLSFLCKRRHRDLKGLTIWTRNEDD